MRVEKVAAEREGRRLSEKSSINPTLRVPEVGMGFLCVWR